MKDFVSNHLRSSTKAKLSLLLSFTLASQFTMYVVSNCNSSGNILFVVAVTLSALSLEVILYLVLRKYNVDGMVAIPTLAVAMCIFGTFAFYGTIMLVWTKSGLGLECLG